MVERIFKTYFSNEQLSWVMAGGVFLIIAIILQFSRFQRYSLFALVLGAFAINFFSALLDPFVNMWDERFHALVAKNMLENPFIPMLYTENPVEIDNSFWSMGHIWLHKQPLFLWQIALSFKIFGINEIALRLPNIIMCSLLIYPLFQLGRILVNERTGFMTSFLFITSFYFGELVAGWQLLDHNDIAFLFYTTLSIWAWVEYTEREKKSWILLAGLFSGLAILNKWLVGLLVFAGWITMILTNKNLRSN